MAPLQISRTENPPLEAAVALIIPLIDLIVEWRFDELASLSRGGLTASGLRESAASYPATFRSDPMESANSIRIDPVEEHNWLVDMNLCSVEDGRTQLALRCVLERDGDRYVAVPWDLLVR